MQIIILGNTIEEAREKFIKLTSCYSKEYVENITNTRSLMRMVLKDGTIIRALSYNDDCRGYRADFMYISRNISLDVTHRFIYSMRKGKNFGYEFY